MSEIPLTGVLTTLSLFRDQAENSWESCPNSLNLYLDANNTSKSFLKVCVNCVVNWKLIRNLERVQRAEVTLLLLLLLSHLNSVRLCATP